jgi:hypothetical protein
MEIRRKNIMGNWRTVEIKGEVKNKAEVSEIRNYLTYDRNTYESAASNDGIYCLQFGESLCGINKWIDQSGIIDASGNVWERDCEIEDLKNELETLASKFLSLELTLNAGDDYESENCVASFIVKDGKVEQVDPLVKELNGINQDYMTANLMKMLGR